MLWHCCDFSEKGELNTSNSKKMVRPRFIFCPLRSTRKHKKNGAIILPWFAYLLRPHLHEAFFKTWMEQSEDASEVWRRGQFVKKFIFPSGRIHGSKKVNLPQAGVSFTYTNHRVIIALLPFQASNQYSWLFLDRACIFLEHHIIDKRIFDTQTEAYTFRPCIVYGLLKSFKVLN